MQVPAEYARYVAKKGSVTVDGVSLTVNEVSGARFDVNIIPHTAEATIIGEYTVGTTVNIEVDLLARYIERLLAKDGDGLTVDFLKANGYVCQNTNTPKRRRCCIQRYRRHHCRYA